MSDAKPYTLETFAAEFIGINKEEAAKARATVEALEAALRPRERVRPARMRGLPVMTTRDGCPDGWDHGGSAERLIPSVMPSAHGGPMLSREATAIDLLKCAISHEPDVRLLGNLRACELAALAASIVTCCPACGAEPWVNIDCDLCLVATALTAGEVP